MEHQLPKSEHLCHKKLLGQLVNEGKGITAFPFRLIYLPTTLPEDVPYQVAFSVTKRRFKRAVDRNRLKRVMREAWRHSRPEIVAATEGQPHAFLLIYISNDKLNTSDLEKPMAKLLAKWQARKA